MKALSKMWWLVIGIVVLLVAAMWYFGYLPF